MYPEEEEAVSHDTYHCTSVVGFSNSVESLLACCVPAREELSTKSIDQLVAETDSMDRFSH